jgi:hypothetical protein
MSELLALGIAGTLCLLLNAMRRDLASRYVLFTPRTERIRSELLADLSLRLGTGRVLSIPVTEVVTASAQAERPAERESTETAGLGPLFTTAGVVAAVALIAILIGRNLLSPSPAGDEAEHATADQAAPIAQVSATPSALPAASIQPEPQRPAMQLPPCTCDRSDSALWAAGVPQLSVLAANRPGRTTSKKPSVYPEIAVVNNSSQDLKNVMLTVDFSQSASEGRPARRTGEQGLLYDGVLGPAHAVKWRVKGRGDDFTVMSSITGKVGESGVEPAPADAFHKLLGAHTPSVRLHGAKMLAWLGDARAGEAIEKLEREHREEMTPTLVMLSDAIRPVRVCNAKITPGSSPSTVRVEACVFNASTETRDRPAVVARYYKGSVSQETRWIVEASLGASVGVRTTGTAEIPEGEAEAGASLQLLAEP